MKNWLTVAESLGKIGYNSRIKTTTQNPNKTNEK